MNILLEVTIILLAIFVICAWNNSVNDNRENLGGYGILSGLAFNNNARYRFKNIYDPDWFPGYETVIGTVVI